MLINISTYDQQQQAIDIPEWDQECHPWSLDPVTVGVLNALAIGFTPYRPTNVLDFYPKPLPSLVERIP